MTPFVLEPTLASIDSLRELEALCLFVSEDERPLGGVPGLVDWRLCGQLTRQLRAGYFQGRPDERLLMPTGGRVPVDRLFAVGLGPSRTLSALGFEHALTNACQMLERAGTKALALAFAALPTLRPEEVATVLRRAFFERTKASAVSVFADAPLVGALGPSVRAPQRGAEALAPPAPGGPPGAPGAPAPRLRPGAAAALAPATDAARPDERVDRRQRWPGADRGARGGPLRVSAPRAGAPARPGASPEPGAERRAATPEAGAPGVPPTGGLDERATSSSAPGLSSPTVSAPSQPQPQPPAAAAEEPPAGAGNAGAAKAGDGSAGTENAGAGSADAGSAGAAKAGSSAPDDAASDPPSGGAPTTPTTPATPTKPST